MERRDQSAQGLERRGSGGLSSSPLSEPGARGDPPLPRAAAGRSSPSGSLVPSKSAGQSRYPTLSPGTPENAPPEYLENPSPDRTQQSCPQATSCHYPLSPHPCVCSGPGAPSAGVRSKATSRPFVTRTPPFSDRRCVASGAPGSPSRDVATSQRCTRARPPVRHSQWRRGCSGQLGTVSAAGAQVRAEPEALQSECTARR